MRRPLELYPEDVELHRTEDRASRRVDHLRRATAASAEDIPAGTTTREYNQYREFRANDLARLERTGDLDVLLSPDTATPSTSTQGIATAEDTSGTRNGETSSRAPDSRTTTRTRPEVAARHAIEALPGRTNDRVPIIRPPIMPRPNRDNQEEGPSLRMADAPMSVHINNEVLSQVRPLLGATRLSRANQMSLTSALTANAPSPPLAPASPIESSNSSVEDVLYNHRLTAMEFSQADFDSWYNYQNEATRALVSYADYQHYALHESRPPYGAFPARSMRHISNNSILRVNILVRGVAIIGSFDLDPVQCQTMCDFVHTLETAALDRGIWRHPETGEEVEPPELQGGILYLEHFPVGGSREFHENIQLFMGIDGPGAILWEFWWKLNFEFGRRDALFRRVEVERGDQ